MGQLFRSQDMVLCQLILQSEAAYSVLTELGELGVLHFRDIGEGVSAFQRMFVHEVQACADMERILDDLDEFMQTHNIVVNACSANVPTPEPKEYIKLLDHLTELHGQLKSVEEKNQSLTEQITLMKRRCQVIESCSRIYSQAAVQSAIDVSQNPETMPLTGTDEQPEALPMQETITPSLKIHVLCGTVSKKAVQGLERLLWRTTRGNMYFRTVDIDESTAEGLVSVFLVAVQGAELRKKVKKICRGFHAHFFLFPQSRKERMDLMISLKVEISDRLGVVDESKQFQRKMLMGIVKELPIWRMKVRKVKAVFFALNQFNLSLSDRCLIGECWCPTAEYQNAQLAVERGTIASQTDKPSLLILLDTKDTPPTYLKTTKFTDAFQALVNSYGIPCYKEANPAVFTVITFPFLFALMFGDVGHGAIMAVCALLAIKYEKMLIQKGFHRGEMTGLMFGGRYIILLMGIFSMYTGLIYNEIFGRSVNIFNTAWIGNVPQFKISHKMAFIPHDGGEANATLAFQEHDLNPDEGTFRKLNPYPVGQDPAWEFAKNKLSLTNSYRMKMSIVFGVLQMSFGIFVGLCNHIYRRDWSSTLCEFTPRILFLLCLFGYLVVIIFVKWLKFTVHTSGCAPALLPGLIDMFMLKALKNDKNADGTECENHAFFKHQEPLQKGLVLIALICVPWMLFLKPLYFKILQRRARAKNEPFHPHVHGGHDSHEEEFDFANYMILQCIHTIEFVLGIISNTASYLRLWALSLAHSQLAEVAWNMALSMGLRMGVVGTTIIFAGWAGLTVFILIIMEGLSAFLHALRLHWVEFQNKFYVGEGHLYEPFSFRRLLDMDPEV